MTQKQITKQEEFNEATKPIRKYVTTIPILLIGFTVLFGFPFGINLMSIPIFSLGIINWIYYSK
ncbi:MAG: hypothetical protein ABSG05_03360 [Candidatus Pacearchaeota archaeon]|jgi:hypothetical protein